MSTLPVVQRELRVISRRPAAYYQRFGIALSGSALVIFLLCSKLAGSPAQLSILIFGVLAYLLVLYCFFHGIGATSDCFTSEKREGTLGLLFLTDLKGYDIVFGKLLSQSVQSLFNLLSITPLLAIPVLMGGVSFDLFWRFSLGLLNFLFFNLSAGLLASAWCRTDRHAKSTATGIVILLTVGFPALCAIVFHYLDTTPPVWVKLLLSLTNPLSPLADSVQVGNLLGLGGIFIDGFGSIRPYWPTLASTHLLAWMFLLLACRIVPHSWQDQPEAPRGFFGYFWRRRGRNEKSGVRKEKKGLVLGDSNPIHWLCRRFYISSRPLFWAIALEIVMLALTYHENSMDAFMPPVSMFICVIAGATIKWAAASQAARPMIEQRRDGSLELLLSTPMPAVEIIKGIRSAMMKEFRPYLIACCIMDVVFMLAAVMNVRAAHYSDRDLPMIFFSFVAGIAFLFIDYHAMVALAMWHGLSSKKPTGAPGAATFAILFLPWILWYGSILFYFVVLRKMTNNSPDGLWLVVWWIFISLAIAFLFGATSSVNLKNRFRECALERFQGAKPGLLHRIAAWFQFKRSSS